MTRKSWDLDGKRNSLYGRKWRKRRAQFLSENLYCSMCKKTGKTTLATVVDHIQPHRGDELLFWDQNNWQGLCSHHHNSSKAIEEIRGYSDLLSADGWPVDPAHPANSGQTHVSGKAMPDDLKRIPVPVLLVCGPPSAGKSTWCKHLMGEDDVLIDFDEIDQQLNGVARRRNKLLTPILRERNRQLIAASSQQTGRVFFPVTVSTSETVSWWKSMLGNLFVVSVPTPLDVCIERIGDDPSRATECDRLIDRAERWWSSNDIQPDAIVRANGGYFNHEISPARTPRSQILVDLLKVSERKKATQTDLENGTKNEMQDWVL